MGAPINLGHGVKCHYFQLTLKKDLVEKRKKSFSLGDAACKSLALKEMTSWG